MRRLLLALAVLIVITAVAAPAVLVWSALFTSSGLQFVLRHLPQQLGPVRLTITGVSGTVARGLTIQRVEIEHELVHITLTGIEGQVALRPLVLQTIRVAHGKVQSALIEVKRRTKPSTPGPTNFLPAWLILNVEDAQVGSARLTVYNGFHLEADDFRGAAVLRQHYIRFYSAEGRLEDAHVSALGTLRATDPLGMEVKAHLDWTPAGQPPWTVAGSARGDLDALNIVAHVTSPFRADLTGQALTLTSHWHWAADAVVQNFDLHAWNVNTPLGSITGHLSGSGDESGFSAHGPVNPTGLRAGMFEVLFSGNFANHVLSAQHMEARHVASGARVSGSGTIGIVDHGPRLDLKGEWSDFRWPLAGRQVAVRSPTGSFAISGLMPYQVRLSGRGRAAELPEMSVDASGTLGKDGLTFDPAEVDLFDGHASVSGSVLWSPSQSWSVKGRATRINPGALRADLPGSLSFAFAASARSFDSRGDLTASFSDITGRLRGLAASGGGTLTHAGTTWGFSNVRVGLGTARLALDGQIGERVDVRFTTSVHDLSLIAPGAQGELKASGTVSGTLAEPDIVASAHGGDFAWQGVTLKAFDAEVNFNPGAVAEQSKIDARLRQLTFAGRTLETVVLTLEGPPSAYNVRFAATASGLAVGAQAIGPYAHGVFNGQLTALSVTGS
ncbi:MAG TPA: hypothetical protein VGG67_04430, partial [Steroidobacteraceae bacterium]